MTTTRTAIRRINGFPRRVRITRKRGRERIVIIDKWQGLSRGIPAHCFDRNAVKKGMRVEAEHFPTSKWHQRKVASDHLTEDADYYKKLEKMEAGKKRLSTCKA